MSHALLVTAMMLGIVWPSVFVLGLIAKARGTLPQFFGPGGRPHLPRARPFPKWQYPFVIPLGIVLLLALGLFILAVYPPLFIIDLPRRFRARSTPEA